MQEERGTDKGERAEERGHRTREADMLQASASNSSSAFQVGPLSEVAVVVCALLGAV